MTSDFSGQRICISDNKYSFTAGFMRQEIKIFVIFASIFHAHLPSASPAMQCFWQVDALGMHRAFYFAVSEGFCNAHVPSLTNSVNVPGFEVPSCVLPVKITSAGLFLVVVNGAVWFVFPCSSCDCCI